MRLGQRMTRRQREYVVALAAGIVTAAIAAMALILVEYQSPAKALRLIQAMMPTARFFAFAMLSAATLILVLMLTLFSLSLGSRTQLKPGHYIRIKHLAMVDVVALVGAILFMLLLILNVPLIAGERFPEQSYAWLYRIIIVFSACLGGLIVGVMVMLYQTLRDIIREVGMEEPLGLRIEYDSDLS
jgi:hypothetical protein